MKKQSPQQNQSKEKDYTELSDAIVYDLQLYYVCIQLGTMYLNVRDKFHNLVHIIIIHKLSCSRVDGSN